MREIKKHPDCAAGTWWWTEGDRSPTVSCPSCQQLGLLEHTVHANGLVEPSLICTRCHFHDTIRLLGWGGGKMDFQERPKA